jgi:hypothetical protein
VVTVLSKREKACDPGSVRSDGGQFHAIARPVEEHKRVARERETLQRVLQAMH